MEDDGYKRPGMGNGVTCLSEPHVHRYVAANLFHVRRSDADLVIDLDVKCIYGGHGTAMSAEPMNAIASQYLHGTSAKATI